jgi:hypothetical protein
LFLVEVSVGKSIPKPPMIKIEGLEPVPWTSDPVLAMEEVL